MFFHGEGEGRVQGGDVEAQQDMWNALPWEWNAKTKIVRNGRFIKTEVWVLEVEKLLTHARNLKMEITIPGGIKVKS